MDENITNAATTTEAPVTDSAPVEESTVNTVESSEKTPNTTEGTQGTATTQEQSVPKARLDEVITERNELRKWKEEQEAQRIEQERIANMTPDERVQEEQLEVAKQTLKKMGFISQDELAKREQEQNAKNIFIAECNRLSGEHDGKDGLPVFNPEEIAQYMDEQASKGQFINDPETAYKLKHMDAIIDAQAKSQRSSTFSEKQQGGMNQVDDKRNSELEAASQSGDFTSFLKKYAGITQK